MGFCCKGVSEIPSVPFHFLAVKQTKSHNMIFVPNAQIKRLVLYKIVVNYKAVIFFFLGFDMDCFMSSSEGNDSNLCSEEKFYYYMGSILCFFLILNPSFWSLVTTRNLRFQLLHHPTPYPRPSPVSHMDFKY